MESKELVYEQLSGLTRNRNGDVVDYLHEKGTMPPILQWGTSEFPLGVYGNKVETPFSSEDGNNYLCVSVYDHHGTTYDEIMRVYKVLDKS